MCLRVNLRADGMPCNATFTHMEFLLDSEGSNMGGIFLSRGRTFPIRSCTECETSVQETSDHVIKPCFSVTHFSRHCRSSQRPACCRFPTSYFSCCCWIFRYFFAVEKLRSAAKLHFSALNQNAQPLRKLSDLQSNQFLGFLRLKDQKKARVLLIRCYYICG